VPSQRIGANRGFVDDVVIGLMLLNRARRRAVAQVFGLTGLTRDESIIITLIALAALARQAEEAAPVHKPARPHASNLMLAAGVVKEFGHAAGGAGSREIPGFFGLIAFALIWRYHPLARGAVRAARESIHVAGASERRIRAAYGAQQPSRPA
jgi:hypothetical protein